MGYRSRYSGSSQNVRYHADNIVVLSFDKEGQLQWNNVISKGQFDDDTDDLISYQLMNTGGQLHFLFNVEERRTNLLNDYTCLLYTSDAADERSSVDLG